MKKQVKLSFVYFLFFSLFFFLRIGPYMNGANINGPATC